MRWCVRKVGRGDPIDGCVVWLPVLPAEHLKDYDIGDTPFKIIPKSCATGNCKHATPFDTSKGCGVVRRMAPLFKCPVIASDAEVPEARWKQWQPRYTGDNKETGAPMYQSEFVPTWGPRQF